jgi:hypothetical protein
MKTMLAIFYAAGPDIRPGTTITPFKNVDIYPAIAKILGLPMGPIDGDPKVLQDILQTPQSAQKPVPPAQMQAAPH